MKVGHTYGEKWPEKVVQRSFIKRHSFPNSLYIKFESNLSSETLVSESDTSLEKKNIKVLFF